MLPKIDLPLYDLKLPSNGKVIKVRPFLVKEEKLLLMAVESNDDQYIIDTTKQVINNCIVDGDVNIDKLPFFDIDYLFIALRAKSIGESIEIKFTCNAYDIEGHRCGHVFPAKIDVSNCSIVKNEDIPFDVQISGKVKIRLKYPTYSTMKTIMDNESVLDKKINIIVGSIDYIVDGEKIISTKDITKPELVAFVEELTQEQYKKLEYFIDNFPSFVVNAEATCDKCNFHHHLEYKEFTSFFV